MREVVVTGLGAVTPLGPDVDATWQALLAGRSGARPLTADWAADLPVRFAATVADDPAERLAPGAARNLDRCQSLALVAALEAWADAGIDDIDPERLAVVVSTGIGGITTLLDQYDVLRERGARRVSPFTVPRIMPNGPAAAIGLHLQARPGVRLRFGGGSRCSRTRSGPRRSRRRCRLRRFGSRRLAVADGGVRLHARVVDPERRTGGGVPAVRQAAGRVRPR